MIGLLESEWIKLRSTTSPYWMYGLGVLATVIVGAVVGRIGSAGATVEGSSDGMLFFVVIAVSVFLQSFVWVAAVLSVTGEYRHQTARIAYLAAPRRWDAVLAKTAVIGGITVVVSAVAIGLGVIAGAILGSDNGWSLLSGDGLRYLLRVPIYLGVGALGCIGLAYVLRNAAGAISIMLVWTLAFEDVLRQVPRVGTALDSWLPLGNGQYWAWGDPAVTVIDWGQTPALVWYLVVCVVLWAVGLASVMIRDA